MYIYIIQVLKKKKTVFDFLTLFTRQLINRKIELICQADNNSYVTSTEKQFYTN